jgi:hypothetical protein
MEDTGNLLVNIKEKSGAEFRVSARIVLRPGDRFRASGGPYYEAREPDGTVTRSRMRDSGPFTFVGWYERDGRTFLKAYSPEGFTVLNLGSEYRNPDLPAYVKAPYRNIRRVGTTKRQRAAERCPNRHTEKVGGNANPGADYRKPVRNGNCHITPVQGAVESISSPMPGRSKENPKSLNRCVGGEVQRGRLCSN